MIDPTLVTTALEVPGYRIVRNFGVVRGIVVRSRSVVGTIGASLQTLVGGDITLFTDLCETTREDAFHKMLQHAAERGANAVISMRYDERGHEWRHRSAGVRNSGDGGESQRHREAVTAP